MKRHLSLVLLVAAAALFSLSGGDVARAQTETGCYGDGVKTGRIIIGTPLNDTINCGQSREDLIMIGLGGDDWLIGGAGSDVMYGGDGDDVVLGRAGNDFLKGGDGIDLVTGGYGNDILRGEGGDDWVFGSTGDDVLYGGDGKDLMVGGHGLDLCDGQGGDEDVATNSCEARKNVP